MVAAGLVGASPYGRGAPVRPEPRPHVLPSLVARVAGPAARPEFVEMPGGASTRRFWRVTWAPGRSAIAMFVPDATRPDEIVKHDDLHDGRRRRWPFLEVRELLEARGIAVPAILAEDCDEGVILVEDLGDDTLARYLERHPESREPLYQSAVRDLAVAQRVLSDLPPDSVVRGRRFDADLLRWELDHFREWALEAQGVVLSPTELRAFEALATRLANRIADCPSAFVHRDYQSRNLMVRERGGARQLVWIDFQDALGGPRVYDLVALLNDSYQTFDRAFVEARLDEYAAHQGLDAEGRRAVGLEFELVTVQRKLKDAGRFVYIDRVKGDASFLGFVAPTLDKAARALERLPDALGYGELAPFIDRARAATAR